MIRFNIKDLYHSSILIVMSSSIFLIIPIIVYKKIHTFNYRFRYHDLYISIADTCWHHTKTTTQIFSQLLANDSNSEKLWKSKEDFAHVNKENLNHRVSILNCSGKTNIATIMWIHFIYIISIHFSSTVMERIS